MFCVQKIVQFKNTHDSLKIEIKTAYKNMKL